MKIQRRLWVLLLSAAMILTLLPAAAFADDAADTKAGAPEPKWVTYEGAPLRGVLGTDRLYNLETPDVSGFVVTFSDGSEKTYIYREEEYGEGDDAYTVGTFIDTEAAEQDPQKADICLYAAVAPDGENPVSFEKEWNDNVKLQVIVQYAVSGGGIDQKVLSTYVDVLCAADSYPKAVEFIPAEGFTPETTAGGSFVSEDSFYGEGNAFRVSYNGWTEADPEKGIPEGFEDFTRTYYYAKGPDASGEEVEGFFVSGNPTRQDFVLDQGAACDIAFGEEADVEFEYTEYVEAYDEYVTVPFTVKVKASKYDAFVNYPIFKYTGEPVKPEFKVYGADNKLISAEAYDVEAEDNVEMGWYEAKITFNDKFADKDKYADTITASYGIGPAAPSIKDPVAGKKSLTVKWKKPTAAQLKNIDGFYIELSTDKQFIGNYRKVNVKKDAVKKGKKTVKGLKKGKKYYVRLYAYKTITQDEETFKMGSNFSKIKYKKTK